MNKSWYILFSFLIWSQSPILSLVIALLACISDGTVHPATHIMDQR